MTLRAPANWDRPEVIAGFVSAPANAVLMSWVGRYSLGRPLTIADIGCGAGRNAVPLAQAGHRVIGFDQSAPMLAAAQNRARSSRVTQRCEFVQARMDTLPFPDACCDVVIAHGIWNLAVSDQELVAAMGEAARIARPGGGLFVFTFSRDTLADDLCPVPGQRYVYDQFSSWPQVFLAEAELDQLLDAACFGRETPGKLTKYNDSGKPLPGTSARRPVIWEGTWVRR